VKQCSATTIPTTYSQPHRCVKTHGLTKLWGRYFCPHHLHAAQRPQSQPGSLLSRHSVTRAAVLAGSTSTRTRQPLPL
jgi:hypothetical protein